MGGEGEERGKVCVCVCGGGGRDLISRRPDSQRKCMGFRQNLFVPFVRAENNEISNTNKRVNRTNYRVLL